MRLFLTKKNKKAHWVTQTLQKKIINPRFINHTLSTVRPCPIWTTNTVIPIYTETISCQSINSEGKLKGQIPPRGKGNNREGGGGFSPSHFKKCVVYIISLYPKLSQNIQCNSNSNNSSPSYFNQHLLQNIVGDSHCLDLEL